MSDESQIAGVKAEMRKSAAALRDTIPAPARSAAAGAIAARDLPSPLRPLAIVSGYSPLKSEISPLPLMRKFADAGAQLALPVVEGRGKPLTMRAWMFGEALSAGQWGIREPTPDAPEVFPDILIVPLLAFDRAGYRLGYGAGYYDMTIARLRSRKPVVAIGIGYAAQEVPAVPNTPFDEKLDLIVTERDVIDCR